MDNNKFDIFISYRRATGANDARLLEQALKSRGFSVFFDYNSLRNGKFDERILFAIEQAPVFILVMSEGCLDECSKEDNWVRREIEYALSFENKTIIPITPSDNSGAIPPNLPQSLKEIALIQFSELNKASLFDASIDQIINDRFPQSLKDRSIQKKSDDLGFGLLIDNLFEVMLVFRDAVTNNSPSEEVDVISGKLTKCMRDMFILSQKSQFSGNMELASISKKIVDEYNSFVEYFTKFISYPIKTRQQDPEALECATKANDKFNNLFNFIIFIKQQNQQN